jgi:hypothetical protein
MSRMSYLREEVKVVKRKLYVAENGKGEICVIEGTRFNHTFRRYSHLEFLEFLNSERVKGNRVYYPRRGVVVIEEVS